jgi:putative monooxygenase ydhR
MHIQIVNFPLAGISDEEFRAMSDQLACLRGGSGLISKTWLADAASNTYGGVNLWDTEASYSNYKASELFNAVKTHPNFAEVSSREFGVFDGPPWITRAFGPAVATA